jgi:hypothetical protein
MVFPVKQKKDFIKDPLEYTKPRSGGLGKLTDEEFKQISEDVAERIELAKQKKREAGSAEVNDYWLRDAVTRPVLKMEDTHYAIQKRIKE